MQLIGEDAYPYLDPAGVQRDWPSRATALDGQSTAVQVLEREYGSAGRLAAGAAGTLLLCLAAAVVGLVATLLVSGDRTAGDVALWVPAGSVLAAGLAVPGWWLARAAVRSGRRVVAALVHWHWLPETVAPDGSVVPPEQRGAPDANGDADRSRTATREALRARTYVFRRPMFVRIIGCGLLFAVVLLAWGIAITGAVRAGEAADYAAAATVGGVAAVLTGALAYVWTGVIRVNTAHARSDPISRRLGRLLKP